MSPWTLPRIRRRVYRYAALDTILQAPSVQVCHPGHYLAQAECTGMPPWTLSCTSRVCRYAALDTILHKPSVQVCHTGHSLAGAVCTGTSPWTLPRIRRRVYRYATLDTILQVPCVQVRRPGHYHACAAECTVSNSWSS
jgi:hypothetical protein